MRKNNIYKKALKLALPMMIQNGITNAVGLIDNLMVGSIGTEAMTAVSIVGQLIFVFNLAIFGGVSGPGIYGAQFFGQGNKKGFLNAVRMKMWICMVCTILGILTFVFGGSFLINLYLQGNGTSMDAGLTMEYAREYMTIMLFGLVPFAFTQVYAGSLRETGESIKPMAGGIASVVVDIVFNYFLIYGKGPFPELGVQGAAIATVLARLVEMGVVIIWTHKTNTKDSFMCGIYETLKVSGNLAKAMTKKGFPIFINEFLWAGAMAALTQCYSGRSLEVVAGINISNAICNVLNVVFVALGAAVGVIIGQLLGESRFEEAKKGAVKLMFFSGGICVVTGLILILISGVFPELYETTDEVKHLGKMFIIITAGYFPIQGFLNALYFTIRSGGKTFITMLFDSVFSWLVIVSTAAVLCFFTDIPIFGVYIIVQSLDIIKIVIGYAIFKKGVWITNLVA